VNRRDTCVSSGDHRHFAPLPAVSLCRPPLRIIIHVSNTPMQKRFGHSRATQRLLELRLVAVHDVQTNARLRIPHPATHTSHPHPSALHRPPIAPHTGIDRPMRCCTRERRACGAQTARLSGIGRNSNSPDSMVPRPRDEAHVPLGRHVRLKAQHLPSCVLKGGHALASAEDFGCDILGGEPSHGPPTQRPGNRWFRTWPV
jgi:hypothetical protein